MIRFILFALLLELPVASRGAETGPALAYPPTKIDAVTDTYFGTKVADPYRWLEQADDPAVKTWAATQTKIALDYLQSQPGYAALKKRIAALSQTSPLRFDVVIRGGHLFYGRLAPPAAQPQYVFLDHPLGTEQVLFDPAAHAVNGVQPAFETVEVSADGSKVALTTQLGGSEDETLHLIDVASGKMLPDTLPHVGGGTTPTAIAWDQDGKGFLHTLFPQNADGSYATSGILIYHHVLGTDPSTDTYVFGKGMSPRSEYHLATSSDGTTQVISVTDGDGVHASIYLRRGTDPFTLVAGPDAAIGDSDDAGGEFVGDAFYAVAKKRDARGEVVALVPGGSFDSAQVIVPASGVVTTNISATPGGFITSDIDGGDSSARLFDTDGKLRVQLPIPQISRASVAADPTGDLIVIRYSTYVSPSKWLAYDAANGTTRDITFPVKIAGDFSDITVERVFVPSLDGKAKIPLEIVRRKGLKLDGQAPTILYAYGAYGVISTPFFDPPLLAWLERGGVYAQAMIRGGGEYGDAWHEAARLATKTVSSDDMAACAQWLGHNGYGDRHHLGIMGGSAGGFLMGLCLTRNPDLYRAVVSEVGFYDSLREELTPNGVFNIPEFGTVKDPAQFAWMYAQSPYHNVHPGTAYPAVLLTTGENDPRVNPYNSRKMIARLQADSSSHYPLLLVQKSGQGHGIGNSFDQQVEDQTEVYAFFLSQLK
jgi:prolyl oligopeptidase